MATTEGGGSPKGTTTSPHAPHHDYTYLTAETASKHTLKQLVRHFSSTEQGVKAAMTRKGIHECVDFKHDESKGWQQRPKARDVKPLPGETSVHAADVA